MHRPPKLTGTEPGKENLATQKPTTIVEGRTCGEMWKPDPEASIKDGEHKLRGKQPQRSGEAFDHIE